MSSLPNFSRPSPNGYYDVFLCFRGDTRNGFTDNLRRSLHRNKIYTFMDDELTGQKIDKLLPMIEKSRIAAVIYSKRFASSDSCLKELVKILQLCRKREHQVLPIFYKVDPSELKLLTGKTKEYLDEYSIAEHGSSTVENWKRAVTELGQVIGLGYRDDDTRSEYDFIEKEVVNKIKKMLIESEETKEWLIESSKGERERVKLQVIYSNEKPNQVEKQRQPSGQASSNGNYDVFLSFRGIDTREGFISSLCYALCLHGVRTFMDTDLVVGSVIGTGLFEAIEKSRMSIVVFSENYASSKWCLKELTKIYQERDQRAHVVVPVFYKVDPSELKRQDSGKTKQHMDRHLVNNSAEEVHSWSDAIKELGRLSGWTYSSDRSKTEMELIMDIVKDILTKLHGKRAVEERSLISETSTLSDIISMVNQVDAGSANQAYDGRLLYKKESGRIQQEIDTNTVILVEIDKFNTIRLVSTGRSTSRGGFSHVAPPSRK